MLGEADAVSAALARFRHIVVEGPIGVGKSTLARRLAAHRQAHLLLERAQENPFLARYYQDSNRYALPTQLFFLFQRVEQLHELNQPDVFASSIVSDFLFAKDELFARMTLAEDEYRLYAQIHRHVVPPTRQPDIVLWLQASPPTLVQRIRRRSIGMEQDLSPEWLSRLSAAYAEHFATDAQTPVLAIDTEHFNPAERDSDFDRLLQRMASFRGPREFFDPLSEWTLR